MLRQLISICCRLSSTQATTAAKTLRARWSWSQVKITDSARRKQTSKLRCKISTSVEKATAVCKSRLIVWEPTMKDSSGLWDKMKVKSQRQAQKSITTGSLRKQLGQSCRFKRRLRVCCLKRQFHRFCTSSTRFGGTSCEWKWTQCRRNYRVKLRSYRGKSLQSKHLKRGNWCRRSLGRKSSLGLLAENCKIKTRIRTNRMNCTSPCRWSKL